MHDNPRPEWDDMTEAEQVVYRLAYAAGLEVRLSGRMVSSFKDDAIRHGTWSDAWNWADQVGHMDGQDARAVPWNQRS